MRTVGMMLMALATALMLSSCSTVVDQALGDDPLLVVRQVRDINAQKTEVSAFEFDICCTGPRPSAASAENDLKRSLGDIVSVLFAQSHDVNRFSELLLEEIEIAVNLSLKEVPRTVAGDTEWIKMHENTLWRGAVNVYYHLMWSAICERYHNWPEKKPARFDLWPDVVKSGIEQGWSQRKQARAWPRPFDD